MSAVVEFEIDANSIRDDRPRGELTVGTLRNHATDCLAAALVGVGDRVLAHDPDCTWWATVYEVADNGWVGLRLGDEFDPNFACAHISASAERLLTFTCGRCAP